MIYLLSFSFGINELEFDDSYENVETDFKDNNKDENKASFSVYQITSDNPFIKCPRYYLK